jgi:hypothetical protein
VEELIPIAFFGVMGWVAWLKHQRALAEIRLRAGQQPDRAASSVSPQGLQELSQQIAELRDMTTRYDMSFDAALQRMESRVSHMEARMNAQQAQRPDQPAEQRVGARSGEWE